MISGQVSDRIVIRLFVAMSVNIYSEYRLTTDNVMNSCLRKRMLEIDVGKQDASKELMGEGECFFHS
jgi:hypothetical protein